MTALGTLELAVVIPVIMYSRNVALILAVLAVFAIADAVLFIRAMAKASPHIGNRMLALYLTEAPVVPSRPTPAAVRSARPMRANRWELRLQCYAPPGDPGHRDELMALAAVAGATPRGGKTGRGELLFDREFAPSGPPRSGAGDEVMLPVLIEVPAGAPPSSEDHGRVVRWVLLVRAAYFPFTLSADFDLPVFYAAEGDVERLVAAE